MEDFGMTDYAFFDSKFQLVGKTRLAVFKINGTAMCKNKLTQGGLHDAVVGMRVNAHAVSLCVGKADRRGNNTAAPAGGGDAVDGDVRKVIWPCAVDTGIGGIRLGKEGEEKLGIKSLIMQR